jgi:hypothetical protein
MTLQENYTLSNVKKNCRVDETSPYLYANEQKSFNAMVLTDIVQGGSNMTGTICV